jgi:putative aminopeptidase FrvX
MDINFLHKYLNNRSPVGHEYSGQTIWLEQVNKFVNDHFTDAYGNAVAIINPNEEYKVVIEAHADEISWIVNYITKEGYIHVERNGGSDYEIAPSMRVNIHTEKHGNIPAIFGWPAIHVRQEKDNIKPNINTVALDCGCSSEEEVRELGIHEGTIVTFDTQLLELRNGFISGQGLDNKIGGFIIAEVAALINQYQKKQKLPIGIYIVNAVQEEVGLRGAAMIANRLKPNLAIVTDVTHDTQSPLYKKIRDGNIACKKGPSLVYSPPVHNNVLKMLIKVAETANIPYQREVAPRSSGTDTDSFAYSNSGIPSALISMPLKYMHTTVETVHKDDIENCIKLIYEFLIQLKPNHNFNYL